jgi:signal transduction histidine kinase
VFPLKPAVAARIAWITWAVSIAFFVISIFLFATANKSGVELFDPHLLLIPGYVTVGAAIVSRRSGNRIGWLFLALGLVSAVETTSFLFAFHRASSSPDDWLTMFAAWLANWEWSASFVLLFYLLLLFPDGHVPSPRWRPVAWAMAFFAVVFVAVGMFQDVPNGVGNISVRNPLGFIPEGGPIGAVFGVLLTAGTVLGGLSLIASTLAPAIRLRSATGDEREQLRWLAWVLIVTIVSAITAIVLGSALHSSAVATVFGIATVVGLAIGIPVAVGIAILKYRLYDIDTVIRRSVVIGVLAAFITAAYLGIVVGVGSLVGSTRNPTLSIIATAVIAVAFQPIRARARRLADRLVFGKRAVPYEVLSEFSEQMAGTYSTEDILPRMVQILAEGTGADAEVWLRTGDELRPAASSRETPFGGALRVVGDQLPVFGDDARAAAVVHQGELLGALVVRRPPTEPLTVTEDQLLGDLASQASLVIRNVRLVEDLRGSRQRIVTAQDERAKALERNLHDGAQQQLVALAVKLRLVTSLVGRDDRRAREMLEQLQGEASDALENLRDLAHGIYPPLLADKGLAAALGSQAKKSPVGVHLDANGVGRYPPEVEAAIYFCVLEAIQNVAKYANASEAKISLHVEGDALVFSVEDDGCGFNPQETPAGAGLTNMADRLAAVGGSLEVRSRPSEGTAVFGRVPVASMSTT